MLQFNVDEATRDSCQVCCCEQVTLKAGTTSQLIINYATWAVPIGRLHCEPQFALEQMAACGISPGAPAKVDGENVAYDTDKDTEIEDTLETKIVDPEGSVLTFKITPFHGPKHGTIELEQSGLFSYTPEGGYVGEDRFYVTATDVTKKSATFEVLISVGQNNSSNMTETPHVTVEAYTVNYANYFIKVAVKIAPNADKCEVWRLTARMKAIDCNCTCYDREDCFDIRMSNC